jgi:S-adenosylmethionine decarboxylase
MNHFGEHVTIDGYGGDEQLLNNQDVVLSVLNDLPELLDMHKMSKPEIYFSEGNDIKDPGGWTGVVTIAESHISIHTFPKRGFVSADVYTCKNGMDTEYIFNYFKDKFKLQELETNFIERGKKYPPENIY